MSHAVSIKKSKHRGVYAETEIQLERNRVLTISTGKRTVGYSSRAAGVHTTASVSTRQNGITTTILFGDFSKEIAVNPDARCTEKAVTTLHAKALEGVNSLLEQVKAFYAAKDAKTDKPEAATAEAA